MNRLFSRTSLASAIVVAATIALTTMSPTQAVTHRPPAAQGKAAGTCAAPVPSSTGTPFGMSVKAAPTLADNVTTLKAQFGDFDVARVFDPGLPPSNAWDRRGPALAGMDVITSFRLPPTDVIAGKYDAALRTFFQTAPSNIQLYWSYYHEVEPVIAAGTFTAAQYRAAWQHIANISGALCRPNIYPTLILTSWTANTASKRNWRDYYAGDNYVSVLAWDPYNQAVGTPTSYRTPDAVYGAVVKVSLASGKPFAVAETGTVRTAADTTFTGRAAWITSAGQYLKAHNALWVSYFQSTVNGDFEIRDVPSTNAYSALIATY
jgi:hypothetical protein